MNPEFARRSPRLADDRGAAAVMALFMSLFLIGTLWFLWGMGDALAHREQLQNGADAVSFAAAVYDARGMNVLAMLNLVMAAVLAVLVAMRVIQLIVVALNIINCIAGAVFNPVCDFTTATELPLAEAIDTAGEAIMITLRVLHYTEGGVAVGWPWLAAYKSSLAAGDYAPGVIGGFTVSGAQFMNTGGQSNFDWNAVVSATIGNVGSASDAFKSSGGGATAAGSTAAKGSAFTKGNWRSFGKGFLAQGDGNYTGKYGLPVQNDSYDDLCAMAGHVVAHAGPMMFLDMMNIGPAKAFITPIIQALDHAIAVLIGDFSMFFCETDEEGLLSLAQRLVSMIGKGGAAKGGASKGGSTQGGPTGAHGTQGSGATPPAAPSSTNTSDLVSKKLFDKASMFDDNFAVWSTVYGGRTKDDSARRVQVAAMKTETLVGPLPGDANLGVAKAEFYYEAKPGDPGTERTNETSTNPDIGDASTYGNYMSPDNCLWNMRWRARLRRYSIDSSTSPGLAWGDLAKSVVQQVLNKVDPAVGGAYQRLNDAQGKLGPQAPAGPSTDSVPSGFIH